MTVVHDRLWSPGWGGDSECLFDKTALGKVRGARACPNSKLCPLKNVGGVILDGPASLIRRTSAWLWPSSLRTPSEGTFA